MPIPGDANSRAKDSHIESTAVPNQVVKAVANPDGSNIGAATADSATFTSGTTKGSPIMGLYEETPSEVEDGEVGVVGMTINRFLKIIEQYAPAYEDNSNGVAKVEHRYSYSAVATADVQIKGSAGFLHAVTISCNDAAPTAGSIIIYDSLTETGTQIFNHTFTTTPFVPFTVILDVSMGTGIYLGFTTTADVNVTCSYR